MTLFIPSEMGSQPNDAGLSNCLGPIIEEWWCRAGQVADCTFLFCVKEVNQRKSVIDSIILIIILKSSPRLHFLPVQNAGHQSTSPARPFHVVTKAARQHLNCEAPVGCKPPTSKRSVVQFMTQLSKGRYFGVQDELPNIDTHAGTIIW